MAPLSPGQPSILGPPPLRIPPPFSSPSLLGPYPCHPPFQQFVLDPIYPNVYQPLNTFSSNSMSTFDGSILQLVLTMSSSVIHLIQSFTNLIGSKRSLLARSRSVSNSNSSPPNPRSFFQSNSHCHQRSRRPHAHRHHNQTRRSHVRNPPPRNTWIWRRKETPQVLHMSPEVSTTPPSSSPPVSSSLSGSVPATTFTLNAEAPPFVSSTSTINSDENLISKVKFYMPKPSISLDDSSKVWDDDSHELIEPVYYRRVLIQKYISKTLDDFGNFPPKEMNSLHEAIDWWKQQARIYGIPTRKKSGRNKKIGFSVGRKSGRSIVYQRSKLDPNILYY